MSTPTAAELVEQVTTLERDNAKLRDREGTMVAVVAACVFLVPLAWAIGRAQGLAARPTWRERLGSTFMDWGFRLAGIDAA